MSTSRRRFLALGTSALCSLSLGALAVHATATRALPDRNTRVTRRPVTGAARPLRNVADRHAFDVALPLPRTCANAFGERRDHGRAAPARRQRAP